MAPLLAKRRKLEHVSDEEISAEDPLSNEELSEEESADESAGDEPVAQSKQTQTRPKRAHEDNAAIYAGGDYKSSFFKLQVDELLAEVQPNYEKRLSGVNEALRTLKEAIEGIEEREAVTVRNLPLRTCNTILNFLVVDSRSYKVPAQVA